MYSLPIGYIKLVAELQESQPAKAQDNQKAKAKAAGGAEKKASPSYKITVTPELIPDQNHTFLMTPRLSAWADDSYSIGVKDGLLTSLNSTNADQSATVLTKLAGLAGVIAKTGILAVPEVQEELPKRIEVFFLPGDLGNANKTLAAANLKVSIISPAVDPTWKESGEKVAGIAYRPLLPYAVRVEDNNSKNVTDIVVLLPNDSPVLQLVPRRSALVTRKTSITFEKGVPTAISFDRNSTAVAWASLPLDMAKAFLSVPTELVQLKFNYASTNSQLQTADVTAEVTRLTKELEALRLQYQINEFNRTNSASTGP